MIELFIDALALAATVTPGELEINSVAEDPTDNKVGACALEGQAGYLAASDEHLLKLERYGNIVILPPRCFLDLLEEAQQSGT